MNENLTVEQIQLQQIDELKTKMENMVDPEEHKKLLEQYDTLLKDHINKRPVPKVEKDTRSAKEIAQGMMKNEPKSNREYVKEALAYREAMLKEKGIDPFSDGKTDPKDINKVVETLQTLIDDSEGDLDFRMRMQNALVDDPQVIALLKARKKGGK